MKTAKAKKIPAMLLAVAMAFALLSPVALTASAKEFEDVDTKEKLDTALGDLDEGEWNNIYITDDVTKTDTEISVDKETKVSIGVGDNNLILGDIEVDGTDGWAYFGTWHGSNGSVTVNKLSAVDGGEIWLVGNVTGTITATGENSDGRNSCITVDGNVGGLVTVSDWGQITVYGNAGSVKANQGGVYVWGDVTGAVEAGSEGFIRLFGKTPTILSVGGKNFDTSVDAPTLTNIADRFYGKDNKQHTYIFNAYQYGDSWVYLFVRMAESSKSKSSKTRTLPEAKPGGTWVENADGTWNYLNPDGKMATGWVESEDGKWFLLNPDGIMVTGWVMINGIWYYLGQDGAMTAGTRVRIDGKTYIFDADGRCTNP